MWECLGEFISNFKEDEPLKVAEIAIGKFEDVYNYLNKEKDIDIIKTDIQPNNKTTIKDDISNPNMNLYKNIDILYSIRPPYEIQPYLMNLRDKTNSILIIKPLFNEDLNIGENKMKLKNYKGISFYIYGDI
ncbi:hypothetical protein LJB96_03830 [Methanobrevibacter sp. OttesenSCG-928-K11]|nr:hypothetical protein [Methanobrevibacter sp. OttesenSCG-928-K11]MDL2270177.1 hypothetical protein [Methanobrevibacter sp. OttesenSCG-928-I08]